MKLDFENTKKHLLEEEDGYELEYKLLESSTDDNNGADISYGIFVSVKNSTTDEFEHIVIQDITNDLSEAEKIFRLISSGHVTPCTALDVIEDLLAN